MTTLDHPAPVRPLFLPALAITITVTTWAAAFAGIAMGLRDFEPLPLAAVRFALAGAGAAVWLVVRRPSRPPLRDLGLIALCGLLGVTLYNMFLNLGQASVSAGAASFIVNMQPVFMAILAVLFLKERFNAWCWLGAALGLAGVAAIAAGQPGGLSLGAGAVLVLAAALVAAIYSVLQRPLAARLGAFDVTALVIVAGAVWLLPWLPQGLAQFGAASLEGRGAVLFLAIAPTLLGFACWSYAVTSFGAARAGQFLYLVPPLAVALAFAFLGEVPNAGTLAGGALALAGVAMVNTLGRR